MSGHNDLLSLKVPAQRLTTLSFAEPTARAMSAWVADLPKANVGEMSKQLYHGMLEINELVCTPLTRFQLVEAVRSAIYYICRELGKHFLSQSVVLPEKQRKIANLAQSLQISLAAGYKLVMTELERTEQALKSKNKKLAAPAIHRAITDLSRCVLRASQLYCQTPPGIWQEMHLLYRFARRAKLLKIKVRDADAGGRGESTIEDVYKRVLLLGCCKPNQLRQKDIQTAFDVFEHWTDHVSLDDESVAESLFVVSAKKDLAPAYRSLQTIPPSTDNFGFDTSKLAAMLNEELVCRQGTSAGTDRRVRRLDGIDQLTEPLLLIITQAIGVLAKRSFRRMSSQGRVLISLGLTTTHYFVSNASEFSTFLTGDHDVKKDASYFFSRRSNDIWSQPGRSETAGENGAVDLSPIRYTGSPAARSTDPKTPYQQHIIPLINTSPGGYCIQWIGDIPGNVQAGEVIGIREDESHPWSIAVIRWIRQIRQHGTQFGVELLAPGAKPCAVQLLQKVGENSEFLRGLLLPELPAISQPASLVVPRLPFQVGHRVLINRQGRSMKLRLLKRISATGSFTQFEIEAQFGESTPETHMQKPVSEDDFDTLWPSL